ncbi:MAG: oxidoreductase [bacterium]
MSWIDEFYNGLSSLSDMAFPRRCSCCKKVYTTAEEFLSQTESIRGQSGLMESINDDEKPIVELYRNCACGSTLMEFFGDRRDNSEKGQLRRQKFGQLLDMLKTVGIETGVARQELLKILHGKDSEFLKKVIEEEKLNNLDVNLT